MVFVHPTIGENQDVRALAVRFVHLDKQMLQHAIHRRTLVEQDRDGRHMEAGLVHPLDLEQIQVGEDRVFDFEHMAVFRRLLQEVAVFARVDGGGGDDLLADRVDRRVCHLSKHLLEIVEQRLVFLGERGDRGVDSHCADRFAAAERHRAHAIAVFLVGVAEGLLQPGRFFPRERRDLAVRDFQIAQGDQIAVKPFAVGLAARIPFLDLLVAEHHAAHRIHEEKLAGMQALLAQHLILRQIQHADLRGQNEPPVRHDVVAGGAQSVAVEHSAHEVAVGEEDGRGAVPRLHHGRVILIEIAQILRDGVVVVPRLRDGDHHRQRQLHAAHHEKFQRVVEHRGVRTGGIDDGKHLCDIVRAEGRGAHGFLAREHFVGVAADGVDLAVVYDETVRVGALPARIGVGGEAGVDDRDRGVVVLVLQIGKEGAQLADEEHALVHDGAARERGDIGVVVALLKHTARDVQAAVEGKTLFHALRLFDKALADHGHAGESAASEHFRAGGHVAPAEEFQPFLFQNDFKHFLGLAAAQFILREEEHAHAVFPFPADLDALLSAHAGKEAV